MNLKDTFTHICNQRYRGVPGVDVWDSGKPGPTVGFTIMTHGNEPAGLAAYSEFLEKGMAKALLKGRVIWCLNNIEATRKFLDLPASATFEEKLHTRSTDINMNRLPRNLRELSTDDSRYEVRRALEVLPIWEEFDVALDVHTTSQPSELMMFVCDYMTPEVFDGFPIEKYITNLSNITRDTFAITYYGKEGKAKSMCIEAGHHDQPEALAIAETCMRVMLHNQGMLAEAMRTEVHEYEHYHVTSGIFLPTENYLAVKVFPNFEPIEVGQLFAEGDGEPIYFQQKGHVIMCPKIRKAPNHLLEEVVYLTEPVQRVRFSGDDE